MDIELTHEDLIFIKAALAHYGLVRDNKEQANAILVKINKSEPSKLG